MQYLGGKAKIAIKITEFLESVRKPGQVFVEPFLGGCNILPKMKNPKIGADINESIILFYQALQKGWEPPSEITEEEYKKLKNSENSPLKGFAGIACSFSGKYFGGYARNGTRNYAQNGKNTALKTASLIKDSIIVHSNYKSLKYPDNSLIYCDIPYKGTTRYTTSFNYEEFYTWAIEMNKAHDVYISEYNMPEQFEEVFRIIRALEMQGKNKMRVEKIFKPIK